MRTHANASSGNIVYKELSYQIMAILFSVHRELGTKYQEKHYQKAIESLFQERNVIYKKEVPITVSFHQVQIGRFLVDFIVENAILLELKAKPFLSIDDAKQVFRYLRETGLRLGILVNFGTPQLTYKRILNSQGITQPEIQ